MRGPERRPFEQSEDDAAQAEDGERRRRSSRSRSSGRVAALGMHRNDSTSTMTASGTLRKNTARQLTCSISHPPITGPIAAVMR